MGYILFAHQGQVPGTLRADQGDDVGVHPEPSAGDLEIVGYDQVQILFVELGGRVGLQVLGLP